MKRVVITGLGIYSTIGKTIDEVTDSLYNGRSGIGFDPVRKEMGFRSGLTGLLERPSLKGLLKRRQRVGIAEEGEYAYMATVDALAQAKIDQEYLNKNVVGILYGNDSSAKAVVESHEALKAKKDTALIGSGGIFQSMNSTITMSLSTIFRLKGINLTVSAACASGSHALGLAYQLIKSGLEETIICGGGQEINAESMGSFDGLGAFSTYEEEPQKACRPFDKTRNGLVPSGGAATLIVESLESAQRRGAPILGEIIGYGFSSNGDHISVPNIEGPTRAMKMALDMAHIKSDVLDYINAHATATPVGDQNEAEAIANIVGNNNTPVSSTKSMTGHEMWMGGASEVIYSLIMMHNDFVAPNINFSEPDEHSRKLNIATKTLKSHNIDTFLSNSFGFGGTNSAIIVKKYK